ARTSRLCGIMHKLPRTRSRETRRPRIASWRFDAKTAAPRGAAGHVGKCSPLPTLPSHAAAGQGRGSRAGSNGARRTSPASYGIFMQKWVAVFILTAAAVAAAWWWLGRPLAARAVATDPGRIQCMSYTPFRGDETPLNAATHAEATRIE